jgi:ABC-type uncharacterized transport system substrate-binding protein
MLFRFYAPFLLFGLLCGCYEAAAHPHVWVGVKAKIAFNPSGALTGIRHEWTFDEVYSAFATQGLKSKQQGVFTRQDLAPLAKLNMENLKESDFFTHAKVDGNKAAFGDPVDYWLEYKNKVLTLHFTMPLKPAVKAKALELAVYDPQYYVDFSLAEQEPVALSGAPASCKTNVVKQEDTGAPRSGDSYFRQLNSSGFGSQFASTISVRCE